MIFYPARIQQENGRFLVTFRDVLDGSTMGDTSEEAEAKACQALAYGLSYYFDRRLETPAPSPAQEGEVWVMVRLIPYLKLVLRNLLVIREQTLDDLAKAIGKKGRHIEDIMSMDHATKVEALEAAFVALGFVIGVDVYPAERLKTYVK